MTNSLSDRIVSALSYLWILFFLPLLVIPKSSFGRFHANQGLINLILGLVLALASRVLSIVPLFGGILTWLFGIVTSFFTLWGIVCALLGVEKPLPIIGEIKLIR